MATEIILIRQKQVKHSFKLYCERKKDYFKPEYSGAWSGRNLCSGCGFSVYDGKHEDAYEVSIEK